MAASAHKSEQGDAFPNRLVVCALLSGALIWGAAHAHARDGELAPTSQGSSEISIEIPPRFTFEALPTTSGAQNGVAADLGFCIRTNGLQRGYEVSRSITDLRGVTKLASPSLTGQASHAGFSANCLRKKNIIEWRSNDARSNASGTVLRMQSVAMVLTPQL